MRLQMVVLAAAMVVLSVGVASAQKISIGPIAGFTLPMGDFGNVSGAGFHIGATGDYELTGGFSVGGDVVWHHSSGKSDFEKELSAANGQATDVTFTIIPIVVHGKYSFPGATHYRPYLKAGLGLYHLGTKIDAGSLGSATDSANKFGLSLGGGTSLTQRGSMTIGLDGAVHMISTEGSSTNMFTISATAMFGAGSK